MFRRPLPCPCQGQCFSQERLRTIVERGPGHAIDRKWHTRRLELGSEALRVGVRPALGKDPARHQLSFDDGRGERDRHVHHHGLDAGIGQVGQEGPLPDRTERHRKPVRPSPPRFEDVVHAVVGRIHAGQERGPRRPGMGGERGPQRGPPAPRHQSGKVGQDT